MITNFVPVNETVTDFCWNFLEFMDIRGSCTVFGNLVGPFIFIISKTKNAVNYYRVEDKFIL